MDGDAGSLDSVCGRPAGPQQVMEVEMDGWWCEPPRPFLSLESSRSRRRYWTGKSRRGVTHRLGFDGVRGTTTALRQRCRSIRG